MVLAVTFEAGEKINLAIESLHLTMCTKKNKYIPLYLSPLCVAKASIRLVFCFPSISSLNVQTASTQDKETAACCKPNHDALSSDPSSSRFVIDIWK